MVYEYIVRMPDGNDKVHFQEDGTPLIVGQHVWSKSFTVTKVVKQPDRDGKGGVVEARADRSR
jgi:hypothetical protein